MIMAVEIQRFWGELFSMKGNANLNIRKLLIDDGMMFWAEESSM